jgi:CubicO group peptidase (beta-lactamase class C family)
MLASSRLSRPTTTAVRLPILPLIAHRPRTAMLATLLRMLIVCLGGFGCTRAVTEPVRAQSTPARERWPVPDWETSTAESEGVSSAGIDAALTYLRDHDARAHSLTLVRHGVLIVDAYFYPFARDARHDLASVTKSITATLVGIAITRRQIQSLDEPLRSFLGNTGPVAQLRLLDLLDMASGLDCGFTPGEPELSAMRSRPDWVAAALQLPRVAPPGSRFGYCSPAFHLASAAVSRAVGSPMDVYARKVLFQPLGISDVYWRRDPQQVTDGWGDLYMRPRDLAKFGLLYLRRGAWNGAQLLPDAWVATATSTHSAGAGDEAYGLGWWISKSVPGMYEAVGRGGQHLVVWPDKDLVVVTTGGGFELAEVAPLLIAAIRSDTSLPAAPEATRALHATLLRIAQPRTAERIHTIHTTPGAREISGRTLTFAANPLGLATLRLDFDDLDGGRARARLELADRVLDTAVGLDGVERFGTSTPSQAIIAAHGRWTGDHSFHLVIDLLAEIDAIDATLDIAAQSVTVTLQVGDAKLSLTGKLQPRSS